MRICTCVLFGFHNSRKGVLIVLDLKALLTKICESLKPTQITNPTITKTSGNSTLTVRQYYRLGHLRFLTCSITTTAAVNTGSSAFVGKSSEIPLTYAYGCGYLSATACMVSLSTNGTLTVRVTGANLASGQTPWFGLVYLV